MRRPPIAVQVGNNAVFFQASNDMFHENESFVDDVIVEFLKQGQWVIALCAFGLVDFIVWVAVFNTFITTRSRLLVHRQEVSAQFRSPIVL
jgi:hypothetical protein